MNKITVSINFQMNFSRGKCITLSIYIYIDLLCNIQLKYMENFID